jgi:hypothetical protein
MPLMMMAIGCHASVARDCTVLVVIDLPCSDDQLRPFPSAESAQGSAACASSSVISLPNTTEAPTRIEDPIVVMQQ